MWMTEGRTEAATPRAVQPLLPEEPLSRGTGRLLRLAAGVVIAAVGIAATTIGVMESTVLQQFRLAALLHLIVVILATVVAGFMVGAMTTVAAAGTLVWFFSPLRKGTGPGLVEDAIALAVFTAVGLILAQALSRERSGRVQSDDAHRRITFLASANEIISGASLDFDKTFSELAGSTIPALADFCTVHIAGETGTLRTVAVAHAPPADAALAENLWHLSQPDPAAPHGVAAVLRTGVSEFYPDVDDEVMDKASRDRAHAALLRGLRVRSIMIVAIPTRKGRVGAVTLGSVRADRRYTKEDLTVAEQLAGRAGTAYENVRLYQERTEAARTLQRSLLPTVIPSIPGIEVATRFQPWGREDLVGGDFYDVFATEFGWFLVVGDVCGKGTEAAALTGLARHSIRAAAMRESSPARILGRLNEAILLQGDDRFSTVALGRIERFEDGARVTVACGGHPPPLVVRCDGSASDTGDTGTLLGVFPEPRLRDTVVELSEGEAIVFYTDGLLNERGPEPEADLREAVRSAAGADAATIADRIEKSVADEGPQDDRAILVARVSPRSRR